MTSKILSAFCITALLAIPNVAHATPVSPPPESSTVSELTTEPMKQSYYREVWRKFSNPNQIPASIFHGEYIQGVYCSGFLHKSKTIWEGHSYLVVFRGTISG